MVVGLFLIYLRFLHGYIMLPASFHVTDDRYMSPTMVTSFARKLSCHRRSLHVTDDGYILFAIHTYGFWRHP
jgi:hypothetical protein